MKKPSSSTDVKLPIYSSSISPEQIDLINEKTVEIQELVRHTAHNIIHIGNKLQEIKHILGHGNFVRWLKSEFNWSVATANKMMQASQQFKNVNFTNLNLSPSAIYLLAAPSTPEKARQEALSRASDGESISFSTAKELLRRHKSAIQLHQGSAHSLISQEGSETISFNSSQEIVDVTPKETEELWSLDTLNLTEMAATTKIFANIIGDHKITQVTPLVNSDVFRDYFIREWLRMEREGSHLSIILCAVDRRLPTREPLNSAEKIGIEQVTQVINQTLKRPADFFTYVERRFFVIVLPSTKREGAMVIAKLIQAQVSDIPQFVKEELMLRLFVHGVVPSRKLSLNNFFDDIFLKYEVGAQGLRP